MGWHVISNSQMEELQQPPMTIHSWELNMNLLNPVSCTWVIVARAVCMRSATWQPTTLKGKVSPLHVKLHEQIVFLFFCLKFCCHCRGVFFFLGGWFSCFFPSRVVLDSLVHHNDMGIPFLEAICIYNCMQAPPPLQSANKSWHQQQTHKSANSHWLPPRFTLNLNPKKP